MSSAVALRVVAPNEAPPRAEQAPLRPTVMFVRDVLGEPWRVKCVLSRAKQTPRNRVRFPPPPPPPVYGPIQLHPLPLETYRARARHRRDPVRPAALHAYVPRRQRPGARPRSLGLHPLTDLERARLLEDEALLAAAGVLHDRPENEGDADCSNIADPDPCPWAGCRAHLAIERDERTGTAKLNHPDKEVWELAETCAHRAVRDRGALSLEEVGKLLNLTQEGVRKIEEQAKAKGRAWAHRRSGDV